MKLAHWIGALLVVGVVLFLLRPTADPDLAAAEHPSSTAAAAPRAPDEGLELASADENRESVASVPEGPSTDAPEPVATDKQQPETLLVVRVINQHRSPLPNVPVTVIAQSTKSWTTNETEAARGGLGDQLRTDDSGEVTVEVPAATALMIFVSSSEKYYRVENKPFPGVARGEVARLEIIATALEGRFFGRVVAAEDGSPLAGVEVRARAPQGMSFGRKPKPLWVRGSDPTTTTNGTGLFELSLEEWGDGSAIAASKERAAVIFGVVESFSSPETPKVIRLSRAARLTGRVDGLRASPIPTWVRLSCSRYHLNVDDTLPFLGGTDALWSGLISDSGTFTVDGIPAHTPLTAYVGQQHAVFLRQPAPLTFKPGETRTVQWKIGSGATVRIEVVDDSGTAQERVEVRLFAGSDLYGNWIEEYDDAARRVATDASGRATIDDVMPGEWALGPAPVSGLAPVATRFTVTPEMRELDVTLRVHGGIQIRGRVIGPGGESVKRANVSASLADGQLHINENIERDGTFTLGPLPPGKFRLTANAYGAKTWRASEPLDVEAGTEGVELRLQLGGSVTVRLVDPATGAALAGSASIHSVGGKGYRSVHAGNSTEFVLGGLATGLYHVIGTSKDGRIGALRDIQITEGHELGPFDVHVERAGSVRVLYTGPAEYASYTLEQSGVKFGMEGVRSGTSESTASPAGSVTVHLDVRPGTTDANGEPTKIQRSQTVVVAAGSETIVEFEIEE
ncbi:MAG: carboxypeptidase regulatory-like domain-containing protein [bacterium]|nr:carboxypeptidase regulatory-like domain-containing protein [bacterium]